MVSFWLVVGCLNLSSRILCQMSGGNFCVRGLHLPSFLTHNEMNAMPYPSQP